MCNSIGIEVFPSIIFLAVKEESFFLLTALRQAQDRPLVFGLLSLFCHLSFRESPGGTDGRAYILPGGTVVSARVMTGKLYALLWVGRGISTNREVKEEAERGALLKEQNDF